MAKSPWKKFGDPSWIENGVAYVGIDPSLTGFAVSMLNSEDLSKHYTGVYTSPHKGVMRLIDIERALAEFTDDLLEIKDVSMEGTVVRSQAASVLGELSGVVKVWLARTCLIAPLKVPPTSLKKYVTGKGTGIQKNQMLLATFRAWGVEFTDDNAADAYGLARVAAGLAETQYRRDVLNVLDDSKFRDELQ